MMSVEEMVELLSEPQQRWLTAVGSGPSKEPYVSQGYQIEITQVDWLTALMGFLEDE